MACNFALRQLAEADIEGILDYIAADNPQAALEFYNELFRLFALLGQFPQMGRERNELLPGIRSMPFGNYVVFYSGREPLEIIRVLHGARDLNVAFSGM